MTRDANPAKSFGLFAEGSCSFCASSWNESHALVGAATADARICDNCLGRACAVLVEHADMRAVPELPGSEFPDEALTEIKARIVAKTVPETPPRSADYPCSFCSEKWPAVPVLVVGPRVLICNACVSEAVAVVKHNS